MITWIKRRKALFVYLSVVLLYFFLVGLFSRFNVLFLPWIRFQNLISILILISAFLVGGFYWVKDAKMIPDILLLSPVFIIILPLLLLGLGSNRLDTILYTLIALLIIFSQIKYFKENPSIWLVLTGPLLILSFILSFSNLLYFSVLFLYAILAFVKLYYENPKLSHLVAGIGLIMPILFLSIIILFSADQWIKDDSELGFTMLEEENLLVVVEQVSVLITGTIYFEVYEPMGLGFYIKKASTSREGYTLPSLTSDNLIMNNSIEDSLTIRLENEDLELDITP